MKGKTVMDVYIYICSDTCFIMHLQLIGTLIIRKSIEILSEYYISCRIWSKCNFDLGQMDLVTKLFFKDLPCESL